MVLEKNYNKQKIICYNCFTLGFMQGGREHWNIYYTSPQSVIITFFIRWLDNFRDFY